MMQRYPDWPERLNAYVAAGDGTRFRWGDVDCCLWASGGVEAMTGVDPSQALRGTYRSREGAVAALFEFAGGGLRETVETLALKFEMIELPSPLYSRRGDILIAKGPRGWPDGLGLCVGWMAVYLTPKGLRNVRLTDALAAWRV